MIYVDLDGVCADFHKKVLELTGDSYKGEDTWRILDQVPNLFYNLEVLEGTKEALLYISNEFGRENVEYLTALPKITGLLHTAQKDKVRWVKDKLEVGYMDCNLQVNCVQHWSYKKYFCEGSDDILIDDSDRNIQQWVEYGGTGILHRNWGSTLKELEKY